MEENPVIQKSHLIFYVRDQRASAAFYSQVLGQDPGLDVPGMTEFELTSDCILGLMPETGIQKLLGKSILNPGKGGIYLKAELYLVVTDARAYYNRALLSGGKGLSELAERDWGHRVAYCLDLDGNVLAFAEDQDRKS
jgi:predicted enzyme related to lactoylglutathione lyase